MSKKNQYNKNYKRTPKGKLMRLYDAQKQRIKVRTHLSLEYTAQDLYERYLNDPHYLQIHSEWVRSGYLKSKSPSIDRIDHKNGYTLENIQMVTWEQNQAKSRSEHSYTSVDAYDLDGNFIKKFDSIKEATEEYDLSVGNVVAVCQGERPHTKGMVFKYSGDSFRFNKDRYNPREVLEQKAREVMDNA